MDRLETFRQSCHVTDTFGDGVHSLDNALTVLLGSPASDARADEPNNLLSKITDTIVSQTCGPGNFEVN